LTRVVYFDCASGASGDMLLGALVDLGLPLEELRADLARLPLAGYRIEARSVDRSGLRATKVDVHADAARPQPHRGLREILELVGSSTLPEPLKQRAGTLFRRLGEAEAAVHGTSPEEVHFHEVGAVDSIVDVIGSLCGLARLDAARYVASPLNVGSGSVRMAHGVFPVPAPATARLLTGVPVYGQGEGELLTPTGALLVTSFAQSYGPLPPLRPEAVGHGAGSRDTPGRPNVVRLVVGQADEAEADERVLVIETEVDDMSPQLCEPLCERLAAAGALDVYLTPVQMKKGRPGILITCLAKPEGRAAIEEVLFSETTTLGVRRQEWQRSVLQRRSVPVETPYGGVRVKLGERAGRVNNVQPEFDDCRRAARERGVPVKEVWAAALAAYRAGAGAP
jgi:uncharacterized protein (TIGR00299 family) protein